MTQTAVDSSDGPFATADYASWVAIDGDDSIRQGTRRHECRPTAV